MNDETQKDNHSHHFTEEEDASKPSPQQGGAEKPAPPKPQEPTQTQQPSVPPQQPQNPVPTAPPKPQQPQNPAQQPPQHPAPPSQPQQPAQQQPRAPAEKNTDQPKPPAPAAPQQPQKPAAQPPEQPKPAAPDAPSPQPPQQQATNQPQQPAKPGQSPASPPGQAPAKPPPGNAPIPPVEGKKPAGDAPKKMGQPLRIGDKLVHEGIISADQLDIALKTQKNRGGPANAMVGAILVELGFITESTLGEVLAESTGVQRFDPKTTVLDPSIIKQIPKNVATRHKVVPVLLEENTVYLAMSDIYDVLAVDQVHRYFPKEYSVIPLYCPEGDILEIIDNYFEFEMSIEGILREIETGFSESKESISGEKEGYTNPTVRLVDALLIDAIKIGASDVHFEPEGNFLRLRYRIDGKMQQIRSFHKDYWAAIAVRLKIIAGMNIAETRHPQDGRITYNVLGREVDFRVASHPCIHGENIVLRILDKKKALLPMEALGFSESNVALLQKLLKRPEGIIIVTGPTGSGKTTTLYSILNFINNIDVNIMTLEDPVEYQLSLIRQANIRAGAGMDFAEGVKSTMRQDPDIIFIGEIRDQETATMALRAAMTGHQVFSTLHTNDSLGVLPRLIDIGLKPTLLAGAIICAVAQRLGRKLCKFCAEERPANEEECEIFRIDKNNPPKIKVHVGCDECNHTGYKGRVAFSEIMPVDSQVDEMIAKGATRGEMIDYLRTKGFKTMAEDGIDKILKGVTDLDEVIGTVDMTDRL